MDFTHQIHLIPPLFDENSRILILGSFPSIKSREVNFFYGHPQNRFWRVISHLLNENCPETAIEKKHMLLKHKIALWDVIASCDIKGSSDSSITNVVPNDIGKILEQTKIKNIFVNGLTLLGGDPCEPDNQRALLPFLKEYKRRFPTKDIWCYTGYTYEQMIGESRANIECTDEFLSLIDYLVDGPFVAGLKNIGLIFRGSSNQRIIDMKQTLSQNEIIQWEGIQRDRT